MKDYLYDDLFNIEGIHWWHKRKRELIKQIFSKFNQLSKLTVLDVGCGTGQFLGELSVIKNVSPFGIDISHKAIAYCKKRGIRGVFYGSAEKTNFKANSFNAVILLDVIEHVDEKKVVTEMGRILKKRGKIILTVPAYMWLWSKWDEVLYHKKRYTKLEMVELLCRNGFEIEIASYFNSFILIPVYLVRTVKSFFYKNSKAYPSDFGISNKFVNAILMFFSNIENYLILSGISIPFGVSIFITARKK